jgi:hypothetical protein
VKRSPAPFRLHLLAYGVTLEVRSDSENLLAQAAANLPFGAAIVPEPNAPAAESLTLASASAQAGFRLRLRGRILFQSDRAETVVARLRAYLILKAGEHSPGRVFVHAGVVAWHGRAIVLPGRSFAGKSTLVAELVRRGALYYSDEYALVDRDGLIHPYAQDLQLRSPGSAAQRSVPIAELRGVAGREPVRAALILFTRYKPSATWRPKTLTPGQAVLQLLRQTISVRRAPATAMRNLTRMMAGAVALQTQRGEAAEAVNALLSAFPTPEPPRP